MQKQKLFVNILAKSDNLFGLKNYTTNFRKLYYRFFPRVGFFFVQIQQAGVTTGDGRSSSSPTSSSFICLHPLEVSRLRFRSTAVQTAANTHRVVCHG